jgi:hypothetical protein
MDLSEIVPGAKYDCDMPSPDYPVNYPASYRPWSGTRTVRVTAVEIVPWPDGPVPCGVLAEYQRETCAVEYDYGVPASPCGVIHPLGRIAVPGEPVTVLEILDPAELRPLPSPAERMRQAAAFARSHPFPQCC